MAKIHIVDFTLGAILRINTFCVVLNMNYHDKH